MTASAVRGIQIRLFDTRVKLEAFDRQRAVGGSFSDVIVRSDVVLLNNPQTKRQCTITAGIMQVQSSFDSGEVSVQRTVHELVTEALSLMEID